MSAPVLAFAALAMFLLSSTQIAYRIRGGALGGVARRFVIPELDVVPAAIVGTVAPLIAAASQLPVSYVLAVREDELSLVGAVLLLLELYAAVGWMAHLTEARRHLREALRRAEERRRLRTLYRW